MRKKWVAIQKSCVVLAYGGVTFGWLQAFELVDFASLITQALAYWLAVIVAALLGGDVAALTGA